MKILGELPWAIVALETDNQAYCVKCKQKTGVKNPKYKANKPNQLIEKATCVECNSTVRTFRKTVPYHKKDSKEYQRYEIVNLDSLVGKNMARRIRRQKKYHALKNKVRMEKVTTLNLEPRIVQQIITDAREKAQENLANILRQRLDQHYDQQMTPDTTAQQLFMQQQLMQQQFMQQQITQQQMQNQMAARRYRQGRQPGMMQQIGQMQSLRSVATGGLWGFGQGLVPQDEGGEE